MAGFSFSTVKAIPHKRPVKRRRAKLPDVRTAIDAVAKVIDPDAWGDPQPTVAHLLAQVATLSDEIEWMMAVPTTPEGEHNLIRAERQQQTRDTLKRRPIEGDTETTVQRQEAATRKAHAIAQIFGPVFGQQQFRRYVMASKHRGEA